jgi:hypothetical protein
MAPAFGMDCGTLYHRRRYPATPSALAAVLIFLLQSASAQERAASTLDAGGSVASGGTVVNISSLGGIGGVSSDGGETIARAGFPGQIYNIASLSATPEPAGVIEEGTLQLAPVIVCDDSTTLISTCVLWETDSIFLSIGSGTGQITAGTVPGTREETVRLTAADVTGDVPVTIFDTTPDNYGPFAADGLDDSWQWDWFASDPARGAPGSDPDGDGQNNMLEYFAGTLPLDSASFLRLSIATITGDPSARLLRFTPWRPDRAYSWHSSTNHQPPWSPVNGVPVTPDALNEWGEATDASAAEAEKFYRLLIGLGP